MILVTVGTHDQGFERLVKAMDEYAAGTEERVVIQRGTTTYEPQHAEYFQFTSYEEMQALTARARVVVCHAAAGAIILALRCGVPLVVVPRLRQHNEHFDDHQRELAQALGDSGRVVAVRDPTAGTLRVAIEQASRNDDIPTGASKLVRALGEQLSAWEVEPDLLKRKAGS